MFGLRSKFTKVSLVYLLIVQICGCAPRYQYTALAPVEGKSRTALGEYEAIKVGETAFNLYRWNIKSFAKDLENEGKLEKEDKREIKRLKKAKYPVFLLVVEKKKEDVITIDPSGIEAVFLSRFEEDTQSNLREIKKSISENILTEKVINLEGEEKSAIYIVFPYEVEEEHMLRIDMSGIKINGEATDLQYSFHATDTWEGRKRVLQYTGLGIGTIAVVVGVITFIS